VCQRTDVRRQDRDHPTIGKVAGAGLFSTLTQPIKVANLMDSLELALKFSRTAASMTAGRAAKKEEA
jgi:hypothetical protein